MDFALLYVYGKCVPKKLLIVMCFLPVDVLMTDMLEARLLSVFFVWSVSVKVPCLH